MAIEYLLVTFPEQRNVFADGAGVGVTNHMLMLPGDEYQITLDGSGYVPASQDVALSGTSLVKPLVIAFTTTATARADAPLPRGIAPAKLATSPAAKAKAKRTRRKTAGAPAKSPARGKKNA